MARVYTIEIKAAPFKMKLLLLLILLLLYRQSIYLWHKIKRVLNGNIENSKRKLNSNNKLIKEKLREQKIEAQ